MSAAIIGTNIGYIFLAFLPPILWLVFYLREDRRPEPKKLLLMTFVAGVASAFLAIITEVLLLGENGLVSGTFNNLENNVFAFFLIIGLVEEYVKYLPIKFLVLKRPDFDEPVDAMIYMMTSAMGFAAIENALFAFPLLQENLFLGVEVIANRFIGANLLHAMSSGIVGFFLAKSFLSPYHKHFIATGVIFAGVLHAGFNYLILVRENVPEGAFYLFLLLAIMAIMVFIEFEQLKKRRINFERQV